jgi:hypothetical protein
MVTNRVGETAGALDETGGIEDEAVCEIDVVESALEELVGEETIVDEEMLLGELTVEVVTLEELVEEEILFDEDVRLDELAVDVILVELVEEDWANVDTARAATVRIEGRNMIERCA